MLRQVVRYDRCIYRIIYIDFPARAQTRCKPLKTWRARQASFATWIERRYGALPREAFRESSR